MSAHLICFDLEGPLSPQDHASELLGHIPQGRDLFGIISRYDDLLTMQGRVNYEPGDTLVLILPYLIRHGIGLREILAASKKTTLIDGAKKVITHSRRDGRLAYVVSTSYKPHAKDIGARLGLPGKYVVATQITPRTWKTALSGKAIKLLDEAREHILARFNKGEFTPSLDKQILLYLDELYWRRLPKLGVRLTGGLATVIGGKRKVWAVEEIARRHRVRIRDLVFVGDSITDSEVLRFVDSAGGLAVSFNGNSFAVESCTLAVAASSLTSLLPVFNAWRKGGRSAVRKIVERGDATKGKSINWVWYPRATSKRLEQTIKRHGRIRARVRKHAARLG